MKFVIYLQGDELGDFSADDLTVGRIYEVIAQTDSQGMLRIVDDSGEDYLYPASCFVSVELSQQTAERLHQAYQPMH